MDYKSTVRVTPPLWTIELLGPLCLRRDEIVYTRFRTHKTGALLAYLATYPERTVRREELIDRFWPDNDLESGRNCLRIALSALRRMFHPGCDGDINSSACVIADRDHVRLNPVTYATDKAEFERLLLDATRTGDLEMRVSYLKNALSVYQNDLLVGYDDEWIVGERQRLADHRLLAMRRLVALLIKQQDVVSALNYAHRAVELDPLREESHRMLIQLYIGVGQYDSALRQFNLLEKILLEQLGSRPAVATQSLIAKIDYDAGPLNLSNISLPSFVSRNKQIGDLQEKRDSHKGVFLDQLPALLTPAFGLEDNVARVIEMIHTPQTRLVTLTGLGGMGKTRLALAVANFLKREFDCTVYFVSLTSVKDPQDVFYEIGHKLNLKPDNKEPIFNQIVTFIGSASVLIVLDSFEHLVGKGNYVVTELLERLSLVSCLITSRQRLNLIGEYEFAVEPLPTPITSGTPDRLIEFASVQLFVNRAQAVRPHFQLTRENASSIASLCHHLEGVPLAIELAAAYIQVLSPAQIRTRLTHRFNFLINRNRNVPERQTSLRATLDWSFRLLDPPLQRYFARLGVLRDGWTIEAAQSICSDLPEITLSNADADEDAYSQLRIEADRTPLSLLPPAYMRAPDEIQSLLELRERSLIYVQENSGNMRYHMLETVREYAEEQLSDFDGLLTRMRHAQFFLYLAEQAEPHLSQADAIEWFNRLQIENANLQSALKFLLNDNNYKYHDLANAKDVGTGGYKGLRLAGAMGAFWFLRGYTEEGIEWLQRALDAYPDAPALIRLKAQRCLANLAYQGGKLTLAQSAYEVLRDLAEMENDTISKAAALSGLATISRINNDFASALDFRQQSLEIFRKEGHLRGIALATSGIGFIVRSQGDPIAARSYFVEALERFRAQSDQPNVAIALNNLADCLLDLNQYSDVYKYTVEGVNLAHALKNKVTVIQGLVNMCILSRKLGQYSVAAILLGTVEDQILHYPGSPNCGYEDDIVREREVVIQQIGLEDFERYWNVGMHYTIEQAIGIVTLPH